MSDTLADDSVEALARVYSIIARSNPDGTVFGESRGVISLRTGAGLAAMNGVIITSVEVDLRDVERHANHFIGSTQPWSIQLREKTDPAAIRKLARSLGLKQEVRTPTMVLRPMDSVAESDGIASISKVGTVDAREFLETMSKGFEAPASAVAPFASVEFLSHEAINGYLLRTYSGAVACGAMVIDPTDVAGLFSIATLPTHRDRGYARALTQHMVEDARRSGARAIYLQSSPEGQSLYRSLGFRTVETMTYFTTS